jgi:hypothetical protein
MIKKVSCDVILLNGDYCNRKCSTIVRKNKIKKEFLSVELEMNLYQLPKVEGFTFDELIAINKAIIKEKELPEDVISLLSPYIHQKEEDVQWYSMFKDLADWRKANAIHAWFVSYVQDGEDDCGYYQVTKERIQELNDLCSKVSENPDDADNLLPARAGFFFGSTDYDDCYFKDIRKTKDITEKILKEVDFNRDYVVYTSSW